MRDYWFEVRRRTSLETAWRQELQIVFVLEGEGHVKLEGMDTSSKIVAGDIFAINSMQLCHLELGADALLLVLLISPLFVAGCCPEQPRPYLNCRSFLYRDEAQQPFDLLRADFARAFRAEYKSESRHSVHLRSRIATLLDDLFQCFLTAEPELCGSDGRQRLQVAVEYINQHFAEPITLAQLAEKSFLSVPYLSRCFVKHLGVSFTQYLAQARTRRAELLLAGTKTITDIAYECGFPSANALIEVFKQQNGETPGQYRRRMEHPTALPAVAPQTVEEGFSTAFATLMRYAEGAPSVGQEAPAALHDLTVNMSCTGSKLTHNWKRMVNVGYARDLLNGKLQEQVRQLQQSVGFRYLHCKGMLDDDMMLCVRGIDGQLHTSFVYLDEVLDFILSCNAKPMLGFGHMPAVLAAHHTKLFGRSALIAPPADMGEWRQLLDDVMAHLLSRYGKEEMKKWLFVPWVTPEFHAYQLFTLEQYFDTYKASYTAIKQGCKDFRVCGPGNTVDNIPLTGWFLDCCQQNDTMPDILSFHTFGAVAPDTEPDALKLIQNNEAFNMAVSGDENYLATQLGKLRRFLQQRGLGTMSVMLDEWSNNIWQRDLCNDTCYKSAYIVKNILENYHSAYAMGYFSLNDRLDELPPSGELFCGGFGLFAGNGMPKSAYRAFELLGRIGDHLLAKGEGVFVTSTASEIQIYLYNYSHYDGLYRYRHTTNLTKSQRYKVFNDKSVQAYHIRLEGLAKGPHRVNRYSISPAGGSAFDAWVRMGAPQEMNAAELETLHHLSHPVYCTEVLSVEQDASVKACLIPHEIQLITIAR